MVDWMNLWLAEWEVSERMCGWWVDEIGDG